MEKKPLVVVSNAKKHVASFDKLRLSSEALAKLSDHAYTLLTEAAKVAQSDNRKTVLARDLDLDGYYKDAKYK